MNLSGGSYQEWTLFTYRYLFLASQHDDRVFREQFTRFAFRVSRFSFVLTTKGVPTEAFNLFCLKAFVSRDQVSQMSLTVTFEKLHSKRLIQDLLFLLSFSKQK